MSENEIEIIRAMDLPEYEGNPKDAKMLITTSEGVKQMSGEAYPQLDTTTAAEGDIPAVGEGGNLVGSGIKAENVAQKNGYYAQMTAGAAENLVGQTPDKEAYLMRPTGGESNEVANGIASVIGVEGNSCVWNQLNNLQNRTAECTTDQTPFSNSNPILNFYASHKYLIRAKISTLTANDRIWLWGGDRAFVVGVQTDYNFSIITNPTVDKTNRNSIFTLIANFGGDGVEGTAGYSDLVVIDLTLLGIDNLTTTAQVEAWLAQHVGTKPYYAYNAGEILSAKMIGMRTVGRNLLNPETRQATLIPYTWEDNSNVFIVKNVPSGATATFTPDNTGEAVSVDVSGGSIDITNYGSGVLELSAATADTYVCMKWDGTKDNDVVPYVEHSYAFDTRKVYGKVNGTGEYVQCFPDGMRSAGSVHDTLNGNETVVKVDKRAYQSGDESDSSVITDGTNTLYALTTPITYTDLVYRDGGIDTPLSEVLINMEVDNWGIEQQLVTPYEDGNPTSIPATLSTIYSMDAVEAIDTLQKTTYTETEVHDNLAALLACVNTNCSEVLGGTFAVSDTATDKVFDFSFTPTPEPTDNSNE